MEESYKGTVLEDIIAVDRLYSIHYFEYSKNFHFTGEKHDFWEMVYVDKGEITETAGDKDIVLKQGEAIFHKPCEWHNLSANGYVAPNAVVISFSCRGEAMKYFENRIIEVKEIQKSIIANIISEYRNVFKTPINNPFTKNMEKKQDMSVGSEQLIKLYIEGLLISFLRSDVHRENGQRLITVNHALKSADMLTEYMKNNINKMITIDELIQYSGYNKTAINKVFNDVYKMSAIQYFTYLKIEEAKKYLREEANSITQISESLGYTSIHYFSRVFKKHTGMSPSEYSASVKALEEVNKKLDNKSYK